MNENGRYIMNMLTSLLPFGRGEMQQAQGLHQAARASFQNGTASSGALPV